MGFPEPPTINLTSLSPRLGQQGVDPLTSIRIGFHTSTEIVQLVSGGSITIVAHKSNISITLPNSQVSMSDGYTMVVTPTRRQSAHGSYGALDTYDALHTVVLSEGAVQTCNVHRCSGFQGMPYPYTFSVIGRLYCTLALSGSIDEFDTIAKATFVVIVADAFNVVKSAVSVIGVTGGSILVVFSVEYDHNTNGTIAYHNSTFQNMFPLNATLFGNFTILARSSHYDLSLLQPPVIPPPPPPLPLVDAATAATVVTAVVATAVGTTVGGAVGGAVGSAAGGAAAGGAAAGGAASGE